MVLFYQYSNRRRVGRYSNVAAICIFCCFYGMAHDFIAIAMVFFMAARGEKIDKTEKRLLFNS